MNKPEPKPSPQSERIRTRLPIASTLRSVDAGGREDIVRQIEAESRSALPKKGE